MCTVVHVQQDKMLQLVTITLCQFVWPPTPCTATALRWCHALTDLVLSTCGIESTAMSHLCEGLSTLSTLRALNLSWNSLGTEGTRLLGMVYCVLSSLFEMDCIFTMKLRYKKLGPLFHCSVQFNVSKSLRIS